VHYRPFCRHLTFFSVHHFVVITHCWAGCVAILVGKEVSLSITVNIILNVIPVTHMDLTYVRMPEFL
jgi:hypothetical protein